MNKRQKTQEGYNVNSVESNSVELNSTRDNFDVFTPISIEDAQKLIDSIIEGILYKALNADNIDEAAYWFDMLKKINNQ
jgi:Mg/Co/Ni transporter MgtE